MKTKEFCLTTGLVVLTRIWDLGTTYLVTPDLKNESNILVKAFGLGWGGSLLIQAVVVTLVIYLNYYHLFKARREDYPSETGCSFRDFSTLYYFGRKGGWIDFLYKTPKEMNVFYDFIGYVTPRVLIPFSCVVAASSTMLVVSERYRGLYKAIFPLLFVLVFVLLLLVSRHYFLKKYRSYQKL